MEEQLEMRTEGEVLPQSIPHLFWQRCEQWSERTAMRHKELGIWKGVSWVEYGEKARQVAFALMAMGMASGDTVTIMSENRPEWLFTDMGILSAGGICAGIYPTDSSEQVRYILSNCHAHFHFVENDEQLDKVLEIRDQLAELKKIIVYDMKGLGNLDDPMVMSFSEFLRTGGEEEAALEAVLRERLDAIEPDDPAILIYTSGTTGPPKGAMLSHRNILKTNEIQDKANPCFSEDKVLSFLPLCHVAERNVSVMNPLRVGYCVYFAEGLDTVPENIREVAPTIFFAVPRIWEKFYSSLILAVKDGTGFEKKAFDWAVKKGRQYHEIKNRGGRVPLYTGLTFLLAENLVLRNLKKSIGLHKARQLTSGAAPISKDLLNFYNTLGLPIREVYGQTECCGPATMHQGKDIKVGTVGRPLPEVEVRLDEANEIFVRGPNVFLGYFENQEKTKEVLDESGWLHTGDVGYFDDEGHLVITDRMKDIIITAGGKNITPSEIENQLKFSPYINDAVVIGEGRKYLTALIMIDEENVMRYAQENKIPFTTYASLANNEHIYSLVEQEVQRVNQLFARVEQIKAFRLIDIKLTADDEEMTPTLKLKRQFVNSKFSGLIESMY